MNDNLASNSAQVCAFCKKVALQKCGGCENTYYCSREHQKRHWKEHSKQCKTFKLVIDSVLGRHYIATRKIHADEIVLKDEIPLVAGPMHGTVPVCLNCYVVLTANTAVPCRKCGWPLCKICNSHGPECDFTCKHKDKKVTITEFGYPHPTYRAISVIRALCLKKTDPKSYAKLLNLEDHCDLVTKQANSTFEEPLDVARFITRFFTIEDISETEIAKIAGILQVNGHEIPITDPPYMAVYDAASFLEHDCQANCSKTFTEKGGLVVRAAILITKGDHISICYTDPLWGVTNRRHHLARTKFFDCACRRCRDPTEFGTMFNAIKCTETSCTGYMLPPTFLYQDTNPPDYVCDKCKRTISLHQVDQTLEMIGIYLSSMKKNDVDACKKFINKYAHVLHENHFYNTDVKLALAQIIGQDSGGLVAVNDDLLNEKILLCKKLNELLKVLIPAETRIRGLILFEMHAAIAEYGRRQEREELTGLLMESKKILIEAYQLLRYEPEILPEGKIAIQARRNIQEMDAVVRTLYQNSVTPA